MALLAPFARSPVRGAETGVYLCTEPVPCGRSGDYFYDVRPRRPAAAARDAEAARRLWDTSLVSTGLAGDSGPTGRKFD